MDVPSKCLQIKKDEVDVPLDHPEAFVLSNYPPKIQLHIFPKTAYPRTRCTCEIGVSGTSEDLQLTLIIVPSHPSSASHTGIIIHRGGSSFITISNSFIRVPYMPLLMYKTIREISFSLLFRSTSVERTQPCSMQFCSLRVSSSQTVRYRGHARRLI